MGSEELSNKLLFGENPQAWALWRLFLVLRDIAVAYDQDEKPKNIEKELLPHQALTEDAPLDGGEERGQG